MSGRGGGGASLAGCNTGDPNGSPIACPEYSHVSYSADGTRLVWALRTTGGVGEIVLARADGTARTVIAHPGEGDLEPSFAPHGHRLLYVRVRPGVAGSEIVTSDLSGGSVRVITTMTGHHPEFSPDGRHVVFIHGFSAWIADAGSHGVRRLTTNAVNADFSPDGRSVLIVSPYGRLRTFRTNGTGRHQLRVSLGPGQTADPAYAVFSPDGRSIAFDSLDPTASPSIFVMPAAGGLSWQPRH